MQITELFKGGNKFNKLIIRPYIIAEAGVNHENSIILAKRLIREAKEGGADAIKFQTYRAHTLASRNSPSYWDLKKENTKNQYELFRKHDRFWKKEFEQLKKYCDKSGIEFLSTPFDRESAKFLNDVMDVFKISSSDITNRPFIEYICQFNKPVILSTGASNLSEIKDAVCWIRKSGNKLALMHCVLNYPTEEKNANLGMILDLKHNFPGNTIGYSDHCLPADMKVLEVAMLLGARIIEKHFTFDKRLTGNDHYHAMDKQDLILLNNSFDRIINLLGEFKKSALPCEEPARNNARRSLVALRDIPKGKRIETGDLTYKRPAFGISPKYIDDVLGLLSKRDIHSDEIINWQMLKKKSGNKNKVVR